MMKFEYAKYLELIQKDEREANAYKNQFIPDSLYKYQPIGSNKMTQKRIRTIREEKIWASRAEFLNDPFEFKMLYADQNSKDIKGFYDDVLARNEIICLSGTWNDKLMWSHYAESHTGMCLQYKITNNWKDQIFPVTYVARRQCCTRELKQWLKNKDLVLEQMTNNMGMDGTQRKIMHSCMGIMYMKDSVWKYEKEYRIVTRNHRAIEKEMFDTYKKEKGSLHNTSEFDLELSSIFLGMNCSAENKNRIIETVQKINEKRVKTAIGRSRKDKAIMYKVLEDLEELVTVWQVYPDNKLKLKYERIK